MTSVGSRCILFFDSRSKSLQLEEHRYVKMLERRDVQKVYSIAAYGVHFIWFLTLRQPRWLFDQRPRTPETALSVGPESGIRSLDISYKAIVKRKATAAYYCARDVSGHFTSIMSTVNYYNYCARVSITVFYTRENIQCCIKFENSLYSLKFI